MARSKRALISSYKKNDQLVLFVRELVELGFRIVSSGGTSEFLQKAGIEVTDVSAYTGMKPILSHKVVTLHPAIQSGLLADGSQRGELDELRYPWFDLVYVDFYPLEEVINRDPSPTMEEVIAKTDIGGPNMIRAGAKGQRIVLVDPNDFDGVLTWLGRDMPREYAAKSFLIAKALKKISEYTAAAVAYQLKFIGNDAAMINFSFGDFMARKGEGWSDCNTR